MSDKILPLFLKLPIENVVHLKCYLESYEGLGELRTLDRDKGEVVILAIEDTIADVRSFVASVQVELDIVEIDQPESVKNDWLLNSDND